MDYYKAVVGKKGIDPEYFWNKMSGEEVSAIFDALTDEHKEEWEKTRIIAYYAASGMNKMPELKKFMPFPWDEITTNTIKPSEERMNQLIKAIDVNKL